MNTNFLLLILESKKKRRRKIKPGATSSSLSTGRLHPQQEHAAEYSVFKFTVFLMGNRAG
jgi:hypothetical protein